MEEDKLKQLINSENWQDTELASLLIKAMDFPSPYTQQIIYKITRTFILDFLPTFDYHRFGCTMLNKMTYEMIYNKLDEYIPLESMEVDVCQEQLMINCKVATGSDKGHLYIENNYSDLTQSIFYSLSAHYRISKNNFPK